MTKLVKHKAQQLLSLSKGEYSHNLLKRIMSNKVSLAEVKVTKVEARLNSYPISKLDEGATIIALTKLICDIFDYFNCAYTESVVTYIVNDILNYYGRYSLLEIYKALDEGRRSQGDLYGKLSGKHFTDWINAYFEKMDYELAEFRRNEKYEMERAIENLYIPGNESAHSPDNDADPVPEPNSNDVIANYIKLHNLSPQELKRREYMREWDQSKGDLETYMKHYDHGNPDSPNHST